MAREWSGLKRKQLKTLLTDAENINTTIYIAFYCGNARSRPTGDNIPLTPMYVRINYNIIELNLIWWNYHHSPHGNHFCHLYLFTGDTDSKTKEISQDNNVTVLSVNMNQSTSNWAKIISQHTSTATESQTENESQIRLHLFTIHTMYII